MKKNTMYKIHWHFYKWFISLFIVVFLSCGILSYYKLAYDPFLDIVIIFILVPLIIPLLKIYITDKPSYLFLALYGTKGWPWIWPFIWPLYIGIKKEYIIISSLFFATKVKPDKLVIVNNSSVSSINIYFNNGDVVKFISFRVKKFIGIFKDHFNVNIERKKWDDGIWN